MKKVLVAGAALMLVSGIASTASAAEIKPGVVITGDSRVRMYYKDDTYTNKSFFGNKDRAPYNYSDTIDGDSRVRLNFTGTAAGGAYAKGRIRMFEGLWGDIDTDLGQAGAVSNTNIWVDVAYMGIPMGDMFTLEMGRFRDSYGPLAATNNFFYDDVNESGTRGIIKVNNNLVINPFILWLDEAQNTGTAASTAITGTNFSAPHDIDKDNDEMRYGVHAKYNINKDWFVGGMLGYQVDDRDETMPSTTYRYGIEANSGGFGSIYTKGKSGQFGFAGELAVTAPEVNGMTNWNEDGNVNGYIYNGVTQNWVKDNIGSNDTGFGGFILPSVTLDKLTLSLNAGFTTGGFQPDGAFGFVMIGTQDNSVIRVTPIGSTGDWYWAGLVVDYQFKEDLKLTGNLVYASVDPWSATGDGPGFVSAIDSGTTNATRTNVVSLSSAWELSAVMQYTISKGMNVFLSAGYLMPDLEYVDYNPLYRNPTGYAAGNNLEDDGAFGAAARFELAF